jgi:methionyl-tRNA formyltransferase
MKIAFFGASELGYNCCEEIIKAGFEVVGIFTIPQEFNISYSPDKPIKNYLHKDFYELGKKYNLPVFSVNQNIKTFEQDFISLQADFILAIGWYYMIPTNMLKLAPKGAAGIHASLLPKYRGNAPLVWAMINGEKETGVSFFYFEKGVDEGDIIAQEKFSIEETDTIKDVLEKTQQASIDILLKNLPLIANNTNKRIQQDHSQATLFPKRTPEDGLIDWSWDKQRIKNFIRAQTKPYPGAFTIINDKKVIIWDADILDI